MTDAPYRNFEDWFGGLEGYHVRSERFIDDLGASDPNVMIAWLEEAWLLGHECGARSQPQPQTLRRKLIDKGWVTEFNADTLVSLIEKHYSGVHTPTTLEKALSGDKEAAYKIVSELHGPF